MLLGRSNYRRLEEKQTLNGQSGRARPILLNQRPDPLADTEHEPLYF